MAELLTPMPCMLNLDMDCPESCPSHKKVREIITAYAEQKSLTIKDAIELIRSANTVDKYFFYITVQLEKGWGKNECTNVESSPVAVVEIKSLGK